VQPFPSPAEADLDSVWSRLIQLKPELPLLRWYRANWLSQHGDTSTAGAELESLRARGRGGAPLDTLTPALTSLDPIVRNQLVPLDELPEARTAFELALAGFVAIR